MPRRRVQLGKFSELVNDERVKNQFKEGNTLWARILPAIYLLAKMCTFHAF